MYDAVVPVVASNAPTVDCEVAFRYQENVYGAVPLAADCERTTVDGLSMTVSVEASAPPV